MVIKDGEYAVLNSETDVVEETTNKLFEAIQLSKAYDIYLKDSYNTEPRVFRLGAEDDEEDEMTELRAPELN